MPTITSLHIYPIKSCAGIAVTEATLTSAGLRHQQTNDREWMVVDATGRFLTQRDYPQMALIVPTLYAEGMRLTAPGMTALEVTFALSAPNPIPVTVWDDNLIAHDCGDAVAAWFSAIIGDACRLVHFDATSKRLASKKWTGGRDVPTLFADGYPILLASQASLDDLNQKLVLQGRSALPMNRFRPNIVIDGVEAFEEDFVETFSAGNVQLQPVKPCPRCPIPSIDQATGKHGPDPLDILQTYRVNPKVDGGITFGMNTILLEGEGEVLRVGQEIAMELAF
ncbi:MOSC domain-containing protein [Glaciimonas sp. PCH181]|uniref:MOSC domain-containing protein n=1 Tax=Glaciimonas sp. PCH181 TaxID=2133943 RepID=UPI000D386C30|nr:MOSC N-terminal beta barrel domain-containing protein [Glaciimonas sp. PCH181]PUA17369.1 MOSC domain-containing protein [Glaciimonas sp. PCH181]